MAPRRQTPAAGHGAALGRGGPYADAPLRRRHGTLLDPPARRGRHRRQPQAQLPVETSHGVAARRFGWRVARIRTAWLPKPRNRGPEGRPGAQRRRKFAWLSLDRLRRFRARRRRLQRPRDAEQGMGRQRCGGLQGSRARLVQVGQHGAHGRFERLLHRLLDQKSPRHGPATRLRVGRRQPGRQLLVEFPAGVEGRICGRRRRVPAPS